MRTPLVVSALQSEPFATRLRDLIGGGVLPVERNQFGDGERYLRLVVPERTSLDGATVVVVASLVDDETILEVQRVGTQLAHEGVEQVLYVIPYMGYSTMERAVNPGEVVTTNALAKLLSRIPSGARKNRFFFMDLHVAGIVYYFDDTCLVRELYAEKPLVEAIRAHIGVDNIIFASADLGRTLWVDTFARIFGTGVAFARKRREGEKTVVEGIVGNVREKHVIIYDDMVRSGSTLTQAAHAYLQAGATKVSAIISHFVCADVNRSHPIERASIDCFITTDTHPSAERFAQGSHRTRFFVVPVGGIFVDAISSLLRKE